MTLLLLCVPRWKPENLPNWVEIYPTHTTSSKETVKYVRRYFCQLGLPVTIVSDNGTCFTSQEFLADEARAMPLQFIVDPEIPDYVDTITLQYTFFDTASIAAN